MIASLLVAFQLAAAQVNIPIDVFWNPNPAKEEVIQYIVTFDQGTQFIVTSFSACIATQCKLYVPNMTDGKHQVWIIAVNRAGQSPSSKVLNFTCKVTGAGTSCK